MGVKTNQEALKMVEEHKKIYAPRSKIFIGKKKKNFNINAYNAITKELLANKNTDDTTGDNTADIDEFNYKDFDYDEDGIEDLVQGL